MKKISLKEIKSFLLNFWIGLLILFIVALVLGFMGYL